MIKRWSLRRREVLAGALGAAASGKLAQARFLMPCAGGSPPA